MPLTIINEAPLASYADIDGATDRRAFCDRLNRQNGVYIGGWNIAPDAYLIRAAHFGEAWEVLIDEMADRGQLAQCDGPGSEPDCNLIEDGPCEGCEFGANTGGPFVTLDVVIRTIRPAKGD